MRSGRTSDCPPRRRFPEAQARPGWRAASDCTRLRMKHRPEAWRYRSTRHDIVALVTPGQPNRHGRKPILCDRCDIVVSADMPLALRLVA